MITNFYPRLARENLTMLTVIIMGIHVPLKARKRQSNEQAITVSLKTLLKWEKELHTDRFYYGG
jgi:hypothetical protein